MKKLVQLLLAFALVVGLVPALTSETAQAEENVLKISAIPDFDQTELTRGFGSFADYLS